jgi:hypothetical protein
LGRFAPGKTLKRWISPGGRSPPVHFSSAKRRILIKPDRSKTRLNPPFVSLSTHAKKFCQQQKKRATPASQGKGVKGFRRRPVKCLKIQCLFCFA